MKLKKLTCVLLALMLLLSLAACGGSDDKTPAGSGEPAKPDSGKAPDVLTEDYLRTLPESDPADFTFSNDGDGLRLDDYHGSDTVVVVPAAVDGKPVVSAAFGVFSSAVKSEVRAVRFPASVRLLSGTFSASDNIEIVICEGLETCGEMTFFQCPKLRTIVFGEALQVIEKQGITHCENLEEIYIAPTMTTIKNKNLTFKSCPKLTIVGQAGSYIEEAAKEMGIPFRAK